MKFNPLNLIKSKKDQYLVPQFLKIQRILNHTQWKKNEVRWQKFQLSYFSCVNKNGKLKKEDPRWQRFLIGYKKFVNAIL